MIVFLDVLKVMGDLAVIGLGTAVLVTLLRRRKSSDD